MGDFYIPNESGQNLVARITSFDMVMKLYKTDIVAYAIASVTGGVYGLDDTHFTEATFTGYSDKTLLWDFWTNTESGPSYAEYAQQTFSSSADQTAQNIYGFYLLDDNTGNLLGFEQFDAPVSISVNGDQIKVTPKLTLGDSEIVMPTGTITPYGGATAPAGYVLCNGAAISRTTYADLYAVIGTTYGTGDGSTTFNLPQLNGKFPLGKASSGTGSTLGSSGGSIDHSHALTSGYAQIFTGANVDFKAKVVSSWTASHTHAAPNSGVGVTALATPSYTEAVQLAGSTDATNPPYISLNYIIKI